jgi:peptidoglycan/LPS O-acetylase OafA/YrhL
MNAPDSRQERSPELDFLRFIAATAVVLYHYAWRPVANGAPAGTGFATLQGISPYGYLGVPLFFLISGFVIAWSAQGRTVGQFAVSRFKRLYPMFWIGLTLTLAVLAVTGRRPQFLHPYVIAANFTMIPARLQAPAVDEVYWTLVIELKFYVWIAILVAARQMRNLEYWLYLWIAGLLLAMAFPGSHLLASITVAPWAIYFVAGAVCYLVRANGLTVGRGLSLAACLAASVWQARGAMDDFTLGRGAVAPAVVIAITVLWYAAVVGVALRAFRLPRARVWFALGALTYPLYLLHNVIGKEIAESLSPWLGDRAQFLVIVCLVYALAAVCARWAEPWARRLCGQALDKLGAATQRAIAGARALSEQPPRRG